MKSRKIHGWQLSSVEFTYLSIHPNYPVLEPSVSTNISLQRVASSTSRCEHSTKSWENPSNGSKHFGYHLSIFIISGHVWPMTLQKPLHFSDRTSNRLGDQPPKGTVETGLDRPTVHPPGPWNLIWMIYISMNLEHGFFFDVSFLLKLRAWMIFTAKFPWCIGTYVFGSLETCERCKMQSQDGNQKTLGNYLNTPTYDYSTWKVDGAIPAYWLTCALY